MHKDTQKISPSQHRTHPQTAPTPAQESTASPITEVARTENQAAHLDDARLSTVHRQAIAGQIGRTQGNHHLQQVMRTLNHTSAPMVQRDPDDGGSTTVTDTTTYYVSDANAVIRSDPPDFKSTGKSIPQGTLVKIVEAQDPNVKLQSVADATQTWWTRRSNITALEDASGNYTVTEDDALIRNGPPGFVSTKENVAKGTKVTLVYRSGSYVYLKQAEGTQAAIGWTAESNLTSETKIQQAAFITAYNTWLETNLTEVEKLTGDAKVKAVNQVLSEVEFVSSALINGATPATDFGAYLNVMNSNFMVGKLTQMLMDAVTQKLVENSGQAYVPPELIGVVRQYIEIIEQSVTGATAATDQASEGSLYQSNVDWNSRLGVPQYRTQSDNLAAPEATCNVTSFAMAAERLGYNRQDVLNAIDVEIKTLYLKTDEGKEELKTKKAEEITVPDTFWQEKAKAYLKKVQDDSADYRKLRGNEVTFNLDDLSKEYRDNAQTEDLFDFLLYLSSISRTSLNNSASNVETILNKLNTEEGTSHDAETLWNWKDATRKKVRACLDAGGAAVMSFYHKGSGSDGTHIVAVQKVTDTGVVIDDPYGKINSIYSRTSAQDAYAPTGKQGAGERTDEFKNQPNYTEEDDWQVDNAQDLTEGESLGNSYEVSNTIVTGAIYYVTLFNRAKKD